MSILSHTASIILAFVLGSSVAVRAEPPVTIGVLDTIDPWFFVQMFGPTMEHLRAALPDRTFRTVELSASELQAQVGTDALDFFIAPSGLYSFIAGTGGAIHIATRHSFLAADPAHSVGSLFVARTDSPLNKLTDFKGRVVAANEPSSFAGWTIALGELKRITEKPEFFFRNTIFTGYGLPDVTSVVLSREADIGILPVCEYERLLESGVLEPGALRTVNEKPSSGLSCRTSTELYPDVVFAALPKASSTLVKDVTVALLTMPTSMNGDVWGFANSFAHVNRLYRDLQIGPYAYLRETTVSDFIERYRFALITLFGLIALTIIYAVIVRRIVSIRTRALRQALATVKEGQARERQAQEKLWRLEKAGVVGGLSAMFAHDARQPIASLVNYAGGLRQYLSSSTKDPLVIEALNEIETQAERISGIIDRVRSYARSEERLRERVSVKNMISGALETFSKSRFSTGVTIRSSIPDEAEVEGDPLELELCVVNILRNAGAALEGRHDKMIDITPRRTHGIFCRPLSQN